MPIVMVIPPSLFLLDERVFMSLGILRVAASLESAGHRVEMLDLSGVENFEEVAALHAASTTASAVCITVTTPQLPAAVKIVAAIRRAASHLKIIAGGPHITLVHSAVKLERKSSRVGRAHRALDKLQQIFDVLVSGDGELAIFEALRVPSGVVDADVPNGVLFLTNKAYDELAWPARHLVDVASYKYSIDGFKATSVIAQLGCPFGCGFSLTGDALISIESGFKRLSELVAGPGAIERCAHGGAVCVHRVSKKVATHQGWSSGVEVVDEGTRPVYEVRTENGLRLRATAEHPFMAVSGDDVVWRDVRDLRTGDWLVMQEPEMNWPNEYVSLPAPESLPEIPRGGFERKKHHRTPSRMTPDLAWLTGFIVGDGCLPADRRPSVHICVTVAVAEKLERIVLEQFGVRLCVNSSSVTGKMRHGWIHSRIVYNFFADVLHMGAGNKLHVPEQILRSPRDVIEAFLRGLLDADGYNDGRSEYLTTVSWDLAREVANVWLMLGHVPSINEISGPDYSPGTCYRVQTFRNDRIPTKKALYRSTKSGSWYWRTPRDKTHFLGIRRRTLRESGLTHPLDVPGRHYVRVEAITPGVPERVYDLRVPGAHSFLADGIVSHNCGGRNTAMLRRIRTRSTENIVAEIEHLHRTYGFRAWMFYDDELNVSKTFVELLRALTALQERLGQEFRFRGFVKSELFNAEQAEEMQRAGFRWLLCGFEAADPRILENINKRATLKDNDRVIELAHKHGLKVKALMSVGHPGESETTIYAVRGWLTSRAPDDFDVTTITTYPGTPYYDEAVPHESASDAWTYTARTGDRLHSLDVDYTQVADYYKGAPDSYCSYVWTDYISRKGIVECRDNVERDVRAALSIPFNPSAPGVRYEHSFGQGKLPERILRESA
jgi:radical SAM superfamily enzyme YgiQ (UPF0313 family)/intein/homing endonuclease